MWKHNIDRTTTFLRKVSPIHQFIRLCRLGERPSRQSKRALARNLRNTIWMSELSELAGEFRRRRIAERLCTFVNREPERNYKFIKDIIPNCGIETANQIIRNYNQYNTSQKTKAFIIGYHKEAKGEHLHFYHNCRYTQSNCRCGFIDQIRFKRREPKYIVDERPFERSLFENIIKYLSKGERSLIHIQIGDDACSEIVRRIKDIRLDSDTEGDASDGMVETCENEMQNASRKRHADFNEGPGETKRIKRIINQGYDGISTIRTGAGANQKSQTVDFLIRNILKVLATPIEDACDTSYWYENPTLSIFNNKNPDYQLACSSLMKMTSHLTFEELYELHTVPGCHNVYGTRIFNHYFEREESMIHIERLLKHQYGDPAPFLKRVYEICERLIPKRNSLYIRGEYNLRQ